MLSCFQYDIEYGDKLLLLKTWWNEPHDWNAGIDGYRLFRRDR